MKKPTYSDAETCLRYRKLSKSGNGGQSREQVSFCTKMFQRYPEWYESTEAEVIKDTLPFGAIQTYE